jgi:pantetheine-phosphate adenylyltransferase
MSDERGPRVALFPASFDPVTNGHIDLVERALRLFDEVVVAVARNVEKRGTFTTEERLEILRGVFGRMPRVKIDEFDGLMVDYARSLGARAVIRGLRAMSDFEYEFEMALMNKHLHPDIEVLFMTSRLEYLYVSSSRLKELVRFGVSVEEFLPPLAAERLRAKLGPG